MHISNAPSATAGYNEASLQRRISKLGIAYFSEDIAPSEKAIIQAILKGNTLESIKRS